MQGIKRDGIKKQKKTDLEIILATQMGILSALKRIKFNPKPSDSQEETINPNQTRLVDFHVEISKKIDEVIQKHEKENKTEQRIVEPRTTWTKTPQIPVFKTELTLEEIKSFDSELFELETPMNELAIQNLAPEPNIQNQPLFVGPIQSEDASIFAAGDHDKEKLLTTLGKIKINKDKGKSTNKTNTKKKNGYSKAKNNYQEVKTELEKKKQELEEMEKLAKQKEEELKIKEREKKEKEKKKAIEKKKREKEEKLKAKQELKIAKEKEREKKKLEKIKEIERLKLEKQKEKELREKQKLKELKSKEIEKQKQQELKEKERLQRMEEIEKQKLAKQKEKELREKQKLKELKSKEIEKQKQQELEEKEKIKDLKEKKLKEKKQKKIKAKPMSLKFLKKKETKREGKEAVKPEAKTNKKEVETKIEPAEDDLVKAFEIIDDLLGKLPDETIDKFAKSDDFEIYEKVVSRYKKK